MKETINNLLLQLNLSLAAATAKTFQHETLTVLRNTLANGTLADLEKINPSRYSPQGLREEQRAVVKRLEPVLDRTSKQLDAEETKISAQLAQLVITSPLDTSSEAERLSHEREIRDTYRGMDSLALENQLWATLDSGSTMEAVAVLRSPMAMLEPGAKARLTAHLRIQQYPEANALEEQLGAVEGLRGYIVSMKRDLLGEVV